MKHKGGFNYKMIEFTIETNNHAAARKFDVNGCLSRGRKKNQVLATMCKQKCTLQKV